jgi:hypothetical protein
MRAERSSHVIQQLDSKSTPATSLPEQGPDDMSASREGDRSELAADYNVRSRTWRTVAAYHRAPP